MPVPSSVKVSIADSTIEIEGPKGKLSFKYRPEIDVKFDQAGRQITVSRHDDERFNRSLHGLTRSLVANMVQGVTSGYTKKLEIVGVGYQAQLKKANTVARPGWLCQPDCARSARGRVGDGSRPYPYHDCRP